VKTTQNADRPLILASTSRYRRALLERLGVPFAVEAPQVDEATLPGESPRATALRLAEAKARAVAAKHPAALVLGSDQVLDLDGVAVSKPADRADAKRQLVAASGRTLVFHTAVALVDAASGRADVRCIDVASAFRVLDAHAIDRYLEREQPFDCAGSVKSEGFGIALFERITSDDPTALIGLPLITVVAMLDAEGFDVLAGGVA
jgi:septum formation protein